MTRALLMLAAILAMAAGTVARAQDLAFAHNFVTGSRQVVTYPVANPSSTTLVGPLDVVLTGMDFTPDAGVLWATNLTTQSIGTINQATGAYTSSAPLAATCCRAFTIDPVSGTFYGAFDDDIFQIDPLTGQATLVAQIVDAVHPGTPQVTALAAACDGRKFALATDGLGGPAALYQWSVGGQTPYIGSTARLGATSLEFDNRTGILYAWFNTSGDPSSTYSTIDPATGAASQLSQVMGRFRMAIRNSCSGALFADGFEG